MTKNVKIKVISLLNNYLEDYSNRLSDLKNTGYGSGFEVREIEISSKEFLSKEFFNIINKVFVMSEEEEEIIVKMHSCGPYLNDKK